MKITIEVEGNRLIRTLEYDGNVQKQMTNQFVKDIEQNVRQAVINKFYSDETVQLMTFPYLKPFVDMSVE